MERINSLEKIKALKVGDRLIETDMGMGMSIESTVTEVAEESPTQKDYWSWKSQTDEGRVINYGIALDYLHYAPKVYLIN